MSTTPTLPPNDPKLVRKSFIEVTRTHNGGRCNWLNVQFWRKSPNSIKFPDQIENTPATYPNTFILMQGVKGLPLFVLVYTVVFIHFIACTCAEVAEFV